MNRKTARACRCPVHDRPRYRLRWRLRDAHRTITFTVKCRVLRWFGWGCLLAAAVQLSATPLLGVLGAESAVVAAGLGGALLLADDFRFRRTAARRSSEDEESLP